MRPRHRPRFLTTATLVALCGAVTGLAAAGGVGPFASLGTPVQHTVAAQVQGAPLRADSLFPVPTQPPPTHEIIEVTDPPVHSATPSTPWPATAAPATAAPTSTPSPTPTPCDDDCGGGGDH